MSHPKKGTTEDEMAGWHYRLDGREFEWTPRVGDGQGGLACCNPWGHKDSDTTEWLNWTKLRSSLVVQWLELSAFTAMSPGSIPGWRTKFPQAVLHSPKRNVSTFLAICILLGTHNRSKSHWESVQVNLYMEYKHLSSWSENTLTSLCPSLTFCSWVDYVGTWG